MSSDSQGCDGTDKQTIDLVNLWNAFSDELQSTDVYQGVHPPPALVNYYTAILTTNNPLEPVVDIVQDKLVEEPSMRAALVRAIGEIVTYGDVLFRFAQYCAARGFLYSNLIQCECGKVSDDELEKWIGNPFKGEGK